MDTFMFLKNHTDALIGFLGGIIGSLLAGVITFIALYITIKNENKKRLLDKQDIEKQRIEDFRTSVYPFFSYTATSETNIKKELHAGIIHTPRGFNRTGEIKSDLKFEVVMKNIGMGVAIAPHVIQVYYDGIENTLSEKGNFPLNINEEATIRMNLILPDLDKLQPIKIKVGYHSIRQDFYEQVITLDFIITPEIYLDELKNPIDIKYICNSVKIINETTPILSDQNKYKSIDVKISIPSI